MSAVLLSAMTRLESLFRRVNVLLRWTFLAVASRTITCISALLHHLSWLFPRSSALSGRTVSPVQLSRVDQMLVSLKLQRREWRMPDVSAFVLQYYGSMAQLVLRGQRVFVIAHRETALTLMNKHGASLTQRFGVSSGLERLGMRERGLIWNNNAHWKQNRIVFDAAVAQGVAQLPKATERYLKGLEIPLCQPASLLTLLREFTLAMTMENLLCISEFPGRDWKRRTLEIVGDYFKAWEFYLLTPEVHLFPEEDAVHRSSVASMHALGREILSMVAMNDASERGFIHRLLRLYDVSNAQNEAEVIQNICEMLLAGTDTSSLTMFYALCFLADHGDQHDMDTKNLYYEVMRLIPVGPVILRQATDDIAMEACKNTSSFAIEKGDGILINIAGMNRCPATYEQSSEFKCTRFQQSDSKNFPLSFGKGVKSCVGTVFAEKEMTLMLDFLRSNFTILSTLPSASSALQTRWDIANTPLHDIPLYLFPRNKIVFFVGQSSSGKTTMANFFRERFPRMNVLAMEVARAIMKENGWSRTDLENDDSIFLTLQQLIVEKHKELIGDDESSSGNSSAFRIVDRSVIDTLFYCRQRLTGSDVRTSGQISSLEADILRICNEMRINKKALIIHFPYSPAFVSDDGTRLLPSAQDEELFLSCITKAQIPFHTLSTLSKEDRMQEILGVIASSACERHYRFV